MNLRLRRLFMLLALTILAVFGIHGCAALQQMSDALVNLQRLQFKLDGIVPGTLAGVNLAKINDPASLNLQDGIKLTSAFAQKSLPLAFTLNVAAKNPNDGTGGSPQKAALLSGFAWTLSIDQKQTISGDISSPLEIPGTGQATIIPLTMSLDLFQFFGENGYKDILDLAFAVAGKSGSASRLTLAATPSVTIAGVPLKYPGALNIVDKEFTNP